MLKFTFSHVPNSSYLVNKFLVTAVPRNEEEARREPSSSSSSPLEEKKNRFRRFDHKQEVRRFVAIWALSGNSFRSHFCFYSLIENLTVATVPTFVPSSVHLPARRSLH